MARMAMKRAKTRTKGPEFDDIVAEAVEQNPGVGRAALGEAVAKLWKESTHGRAYGGATMVALRTGEALLRLEVAGRVSRSVADGKTRWWPVLAEEGGAL